MTGIFLVAGAVHIHLMRGTTFYVDEWSAIFQYNWSPQQLLEPVNGHNAYVGRTAWYAVMAVFGIGDYLPFRLLGLAFNLWAAVALFVYVHRRVGSVPAVCAATLLLFLGSSFHTILWPASAVGVFSLGALVLALLCLERRTPRGDVGACVLVVLAFGSGGMGVMVYTAVLVEIVLRRCWRQWWILVAPVVLYGIWLATFSDSQAEGAISGANILSAPGYVASALAYAAAGLFGQDQSAAVWAVSAYGALVMLLVWRNWGRIDGVRVASIAVAALTFWGLTAVFRGGLGEAGAPRYIAFGAVPLVLILLEVARGQFDSGPAKIVLVGVTGFCLVGNWGC